MMRTSLRTCWRTVGHDDLDLRLRRALAHGSFDTSSIFHQPGVGNTRPPSSNCHPKLSAVRASPIPARVSRSVSIVAGSFSYRTSLLNFFLFVLITSS